ncbi:acetolactate synthase 2 small subunit [Actinobacillus porcinus]|uniref:Acetolactate synthase 2 regulatory subunit n=1 Tax=Actinobacillus porcinus TaxID=51048 RepID=A0ABY6TLF9_9PAST|nr:acetolactate synthase 2 small subunit [Actinobacillus porcinus]MCI5763956.1 acetolactate synthase 2 small subunit [Actinobacillus porcinus]MDD7544713.1 acetolactate synthase 2 small subunit [Actinobacillus porcinus]MDY5422527.1 acetolactate synthase 2 small subunit [Actinobacillus porcinus]MDY5848915.1 acetolactate synthase 2 small subunit [Actinobacillus porcinus]MDY6216053.1 acetolactate synthase 2 small subunit [Actinobacillus porcinus]
MNTELTIVANYRPEVLERILRVVRHRGYQVTEMKMVLENEKVWVDLTVTSQRDVCLLVPQLKKLFDVIDVTCESCD